MISPVHVLGLLQLLLKIQLKNERFMLRIKKPRTYRPTWSSYR